MYQATTTHARQRIKERYNDNTNRMREDLHIAIEKHSYVAVQDSRHADRVIAYFSANGSFLWKVVLSKENGCVVTVLPVKPEDIFFAIQKGIIGARNNE